MKVNVEYDGKSYCLEYTRRTAAQIEDRGFDINRLGSAPNLMIPLLVYGAFLKNHRNIKQDEAMKVYSHIEDKIRDSEQGDEQSFLSVLAEMYSDTLASLTENNETGNAATWEVVK